ncbi:unnamed protein product, partial [marine sediment metagenome]
MSKKNTLFKSTNLTIFCVLLLLFLIPFFIFIGNKYIAEILADFAYGFLVLSLIFNIKEQIKQKNNSKKRIKIFSVLLILFILFLFFFFSIRFLNERNMIKTYEKRFANASIYFDKGEAYLKNQDYDNAIRELEHAIEIDDRNFKSYYLLGRAFYKKGDYESARNFLLHAVGLRSDDFSSNILLAVVFENLGDYDKAITQYIIAKDLRP